MTWTRSIVWRSLLMIAILPLVLAFVGVWVAQTQLRDRLMTQAEARLTAELRNFEALYDQRRIIAVRQAMAFRGAQAGADGGIYLLLQRDGTRLGGNLADWPPEVTRDAQGFAHAPYQTLTLPGPDGQSRPYLVAGRSLRGGFPMLVGQSLTPMQQTLDGMGRVFALFGAIMLATGLCAAALVATQTRTRLSALNRFLERIGRDSGVSDRLAQGGDSEYGQLSDHIDAMLDRIAHLVQAHRRLGNAVAHEMRTPLARIQTRLSDLNLPDAQSAPLEDEIRAMIRLFDSLLSIAEMDAKAGNTAGLEPIDLSATCARIAEMYDPVAEEAGRTLTTDITPNLHILGDAGLMSQLLSNLIENGLKYTHTGDAITLSLKPMGNRLALRVSDTGPGLSPDLRDRIFAPFTRGEQSAIAPGYGLGLALVRAIALRHGAKLTLPEVEKGFALEINCLQFRENP